MRETFESSIGLGTQIFTIATIYYLVTLVVSCGADYTPKTLRSFLGFLNGSLQPLLTLLGIAHAVTAFLTANTEDAQLCSQQKKYQQGLIDQVLGFPAQIEDNLIP